MPGRRPVLTHTPRLADTLRIRLAENSAPTELTIPDPPEHFDAQARGEWQRMVKELAVSGTLTNLNRGALAAYCIAWSRWTKAEQAIIETGGEVVKSPAGFPIQNPWLSIANKSLVQMQALAKEFQK